MIKVDDNFIYIMMYSLYKCIQNNVPCVCGMWIFFFFPEGKWRGEKKGDSSERERDFHFPVYSYWKSGISRCVRWMPISPGTLSDLVCCVQVIIPFCTGLLSGPSKIMTRKGNTSKNRIQIIFSVKFIILKKWWRVWERGHWGMTGSGVRVTSDSAGSVTEHKVRKLRTFCRFVCKMGHQ